MFFSNQAGLPRSGNLHSTLGGGVLEGSCDGVWDSFWELLGSVSGACWRPGGRLRRISRACWEASEDLWGPCWVLLGASWEAG